MFKLQVTESDQGLDNWSSNVYLPTLSLTFELYLGILTFMQSEILKALSLDN